MRARASFRSEESSRYIGVKAMILQNGERAIRESRSESHIVTKRGLSKEENVFYAAVVSLLRFPMIMHNSRSGSPVNNCALFRMHFDVFCWYRGCLFVIACNLHLEIVSRQYCALARTCDFVPLA